MVVEWEQRIYDEILEAYESKIGVDIRNDPYVYHQIVDLMKTLKSEYSDDKQKMKEVITNAIILLLSLYFNRDYDDFDDGRELTKQEQSELKDMLQDVIKSTSVGTASS